MTLIDQNSIKVEIDCFLLVFDDGPGQHTTLYASMVDKSHFPLIVLHLIVEIMKSRIIKPCKFYSQRYHILTAKLVQYLLAAHLQCFLYYRLLLVGLCVNHLQP